MEIIQILLRPLSFLSIKHPELNGIRWIFPIFLSIISVIACILLPVKPCFFGDTGVIPSVTGLLQILTGFFIASLAAIATFDKPNMDEIMQGEPPTLTKKFDDTRIEEKLTRRRFLCYLFGYLSFLSLFLYFTGSLSPFISDNLKSITSGKWFSFFRYTALSLYLLFVYQLLTVTLLGLYYMAHKIHSNDDIKVEPRP